MNLRLISASAIALLALGLLAVACGGGDDQAAVRTSKGLAVAAAGGNLGVGGAPQGVGGNSLASSGGAQSGFSNVGLPASAQIAGGKGGDVVSQPAQLLQQQGQGGITVQGYGSATAKADGAVVELYLGTNMYKPYPEPTPYSPGAYPATPAPAEPITEAKLQPVIDAITGQGVSRDDIKLLNVYADPYSSSATLQVTVKNLDSLNGITKAASEAANGLPGIALQNTNVSYTLNDCVSLEKAAMKVAVEDGKSRATAFAEALGVGMGGLTAASNYSYSPYGGSACDTGVSGPYPKGGIGYTEGQPQEVQVYANISLTYAIQ